MNGFSDVKSSNDAGVEMKEVENPNSDFGDGDGVNEFDDTYKRMSKNNEIMEYSEKTSDINTDKDDGKKKNLDMTTEEYEDYIFSDFNDSKDRIPENNTSNYKRNVTESGGENLSKNDETKRDIKNTESDKNENDDVQELESDPSNRMLQKEKDNSIIKSNKTLEFKEKKEMETIEKLYEKIIENEPKVTKEIIEISEKTKTNLKGLEYRIKTKESLFRKIEKEYLEEKGMVDKTTILNNTKDVLRYTFILPEKSFLDDYKKINELVSSKDYKVIKVGNTWEDGAVYKGINTAIEKGDLKIEIQYHTLESFELKNGVLHPLYEEYRDVRTEEPRKEELKEKMIDLSSKIKNPEGVEKIC